MRVTRARLARQFVCGTLCALGWIGPTIALPIVELSARLALASSEVDFSPQYAYQRQLDETEEAPFQADALAAVGDVAGTGARAFSRADFTTMVANAQFRAGALLNDGSARGYSLLVFDVVNNSGFPRDVTLTFNLPPGLLEFTDNTEIGWLHAPINVAIRADLSVRNASGTFDFDFDFDAVLEEQATATAINFNFAQLSAVASGLPIDVTPLLDPDVDVSEVVLGGFLFEKTVTARFPAFTFDIPLGVMFPGEEIAFSYELLAEVTGGGFIGSTGIAAINDPITLQSPFSISSTPVVLPPNPNPASEPATLALLGLGLAVLAATRRRRQ